MIGAAPDFALTSQDNRPVTLADYRGKVVAVTFIYASCTDTCPILTALMVKVQQDLGSAFGSKIDFVSITVDPERDTPEALRQYADNFGADLRGWAFLTGDPSAVLDVSIATGCLRERLRRATSTTPSSPADRCWWHHACAVRGYGSIRRNFDTICSVLPTSRAENLPGHYAAGMVAPL